MKVIRLRDMVYFLQSPRTDAIKIGCSRRVAARQIRLRRETGEYLCLLAQARAPRSYERAVHWHFRDLRLAGEWFKPTPELLAFINRLRIGCPWPDEIKSIARRARRTQLSGKPFYPKIDKVRAYIKKNAPKRKAAE